MTPQIQGKNPSDHAINKKNPAQANDSEKVRNTEKETRLATESLGKLMLTMGLPTFIAQLINLFYNIVDRMYIGHIPGSGANALTGIGLCVPIITLVAAFAQFVGAGGAPLASISLGKGDRQRAEKILANGLTMLLFFSVFMMVTFFIIKRPFLYLFGASDNTFPYANQYLSIYLLGTVFVELTLGLNTYISAQGQPKIAMISVLIGAITNIILDPIFIFLLHMGIRGGAIATVISQALSACWTFHFLKSKKASLRIKFHYMKPDLAIIKSISSLGISPFFMSITESLITVVFNRGMLLYGNDLYVGSITILQSIIQVIFTPIQGFAQGVQPIISYNYGAKNIDRVKATCRRLISITLVTSAALSILAMVFSAQVAGLFTTDPQLIAICKTSSRVFLLGMTIFGIQSGCQQSFMALSQAKKAFFFALFRKVILLVPLALILPMITNSVMGIYMAEPISDAISAIVCGMTFYRFYKKL